MKTKRLTVTIFACSFLLGGCWTVKETVHPAVEIAALPPGKDVRLQVAGFDAVLVTYDMAYSYSTTTGWGGGWYGRHGWYRGGLGLGGSSTTTYIPRASVTAAYRDRATDLFERAGFLLRAPDPQYRVEVRLEGPFAEDGQVWAELGWALCTLLTAGYDGQTWTAKLRIHDLKSGRLVLSQDLSARDEAIVWGPIPLFSPACSERNSGSVSKHRCLMELTDRAVGAAASFLVGR